MKHRLLLFNAVLLATLLAGLYGRRIESATASRPDLLSRLDLSFRDWKARDEPIPAGDVALLQPDAVLQKRYAAADGRAVLLTVIAGHRKRSVHTPGFCMPGDGWELIAQQDRALQLGDRAVPVTRALMLKGRDQLVATYFFTDGRFCTTNLLHFQGVQLLERLRSRVPLGALVRVLVPVSTDPASAEALSDAFARQTLPKILRALRDARVSSL